MLLDFTKIPRQREPQKQSSQTPLATVQSFENPSLAGYGQIQDNLLHATIGLQQIKS